MPTVKKTCIVTVILLLNWLPNLHALEEVSSRITAMGISFAGIVPDPYTDILRNPAYLTEQPKPLFTLTLDPQASYRAGIFFNPTPFLSNTRGGALFTLERGVSYLSGPTLKEYFPLEYFLPNDHTDYSSGYRPPTDLLKSGRNFYVASPSNLASLISSYYYSASLSHSLSVGVNYLSSVHAFNPDIKDWSDRFYYRNSGDYTELLYSSSIFERESNERLESLRIGGLLHLSERFDVDLEVTASRSRGKEGSEYAILHNSMKIFPDSTTIESIEDVNQDNIDPLDKEVLEGNLFIRRTGDYDFLSLRASLFSGDAMRGRLTLEIDTVNDSTVITSRDESTTHSTWTGALLGIGGGRHLRDRPLGIFWGASYGFMRSHRIQLLEEEYFDIIRSYHASNHEDRWNTHLVQINLAAEYDLTSSVSVILGGRSTAVFMKNRIRDWSYIEPNIGSPVMEGDSVDYSMIISSDITVGVGIELTDWLRLSLYTPDLAEPSSWRLDSLLSFSL